MQGILARRPCSCNTHPAKPGSESKAQNLLQQHYLQKGSSAVSTQNRCRSIVCTASKEDNVELQDVTDLPESTKAFAPAPAPQSQYESTNMWEYKPQWCQPWSILLTGTLVISAVNVISHSSYLFTGLVAVPVLVWWYLFLVLVPQEFKSYVQEQKTRSR